MDESAQQKTQASPLASGMTGVVDVGTTKIVVHLTIQPGTLRTWRVFADATLQTQHASLWVTRLHSPYDFWVRPHDELQLRRGERVWISVDGNGPAQLSLTSHLPSNLTRPARLASRWLGWWSGLAFDLLLPRPR